MEINKELFDKIAHLARLKFTGEEEKEMMKDMERILSWVQKLEEMDTGDAEPLMGMAHASNVTRDDTVGEHLQSDIIEKNAPGTENGFIKVPKVID